MDDALYFAFGERDGHMHGIRAGLSPCNRVPAKIHEAHNLRFVSSVGNVTIDNADFELCSARVVSLWQDKVSRRKTAKIVI